jgi:RNA polymerase sigma-70 factor (ECF subfamily)
MLEVENRTLSDDSHKQIFLNFETQDLLKILNSIPSGAKTIFNLYVFEGYSHKEIAEKLNITTGTSKSQLFKARSLLKSKFKIINKLIVND